MSEITSGNPAVAAYAEALLDLAEQAGQTEPVASELVELQALLKSERNFENFLESPSIRIGERAEVLQRIFAGRLSPLTMKFLGVLNGKGRLALLKHIADAYREQLDKRQGKVKADVTVALKLSDQEMEAVRQQLSTALKKNVIVNQRVDESILGGMVVKVRDRLLDASVRAQLDAMRKQLIASSV
jgi:F-type H+-transporting ATPase subunit delta